MIYLKNVPDRARNGEFNCPKCGRQCMINFENENGYRYRCVHCLKNYHIWKKEIRMSEKSLGRMLSDLQGSNTEYLTIKELHEILTELIKEGHGDKKFQLYYDAECVYTEIPKQSKIRLIGDGVRFTDYEG